MALHRPFLRSLVSLWLLSGLDPSVALAPVSYTHLDVYKRQY